MDEAAAKKEKKMHGGNISEVLGKHVLQTKPGSKHDPGVSSKH